MKYNNPNEFAEQSIDDLFSHIPNEDDDDYTIVLKEIVLHNNLLSRETDIEEYLNNCSESQKQFSAFYSLLIICREYNKYSRYNYYVEKYANRFRNYKLHKIVLSTYYRNKGILGEKNAYKKSIKYAEDACEELPTNLAVKHHYAAMVVLAIEEKVEININLINKAIILLDDVILAFPRHALYYSTQGRLYAAIGNYQQGIIKLKKALDLEEIKDKESMIRIGEYNYYLLQIKLMIENDNVDKKIGTFNSTFQDMKQNLDNVKTQYLEYLAFFSSILSFILVTVNIVTKIDDFNKCAGIIMMFAGALIIVFGVFRMLLYFSYKTKYGIIKNIICYIIGVLLLIVGFLIGNQLIFHLL